MCLYHLIILFNLQSSDLKALAAAQSSTKNGAAQQHHQPKYSQAEYTANQYSQEPYRSSQYKQEDFSGYDSDYDNVPSGSVINGKNVVLRSISCSVKPVIYGH